MGIIEEIDAVLKSGGIMARAPYAKAAAFTPAGPLRELLKRAVARLRDLERALDKSGYPKWPAEPEAERPSEALEAANADLEQAWRESAIVVDLRKRVEALEAREEARGRARGICGVLCDPDGGEHPVRYPYAAPPAPAPPPDMASRCVGCGCFIRVEGAYCGVCRGDASELTAVIQTLREATPEPKPSYGHCPHTPCCHCSRRDGGCPGEGIKVAPRPSEQSSEPFFCEHANENPAACPCPVDCYCQQPGRTCCNRPGARDFRGALDDDMRYESRGS